MSLQFRDVEIIYSCIDSNCLRKCNICLRGLDIVILHIQVSNHRVYDGRILLEQIDNARGAFLNTRPLHMTRRQLSRWNNLERTTASSFKVAALRAYDSSVGVPPFKSAGNGKV